MARMTSADHESTSFERGRFVPRAYETELEECRSATVLPDVPVAVLGDRDGRLAAVELDTGAVATYEIFDESSVAALAGLTGRRVLAVGWDRVGLYALTGTEARLVRSWPIESDTSVIDVAATASGSRFVVAAGDRFYVGDAEEDRLAEVKSPDKTWYGSAGCLAAYVSADGDTLAVGRAGSVDVHTAEGLRRVHDVRLNEKGDAVLSAALSPDGRRLMVGDDAARTAVFDLADGTVTRVSGGAKTIAARWSGDGSACALVLLTRMVGLVDRSGRLLAQLTPEEGGTYYFLGGGWVPGGGRFAVGTEHGKVLTWTLEGAA